MKALAQPVGNSLHFAGEATSLKYPATVHGAWLSGIREAKMIYVSERCSAYVHISWYLEDGLVGTYVFVNIDLRERCTALGCVGSKRGQGDLHK